MSENFPSFFRIRYTRVFFIKCQTDISVGYSDDPLLTDLLFQKSCLYIPHRNQHKNLYSFHKLPSKSLISRTCNFSSFIRYKFKSTLFLTKMASRASSSSKRDEPHFASCNYQAIFDPSQFDEELRIMIEILALSPLSKPFSKTTQRIPSTYIIDAFKSVSQAKPEGVVNFKLIDGSPAVLTRKIFVKSIGLKEDYVKDASCAETDLVLTQYEPYPTDDDLKSFLVSIGYGVKKIRLSDVKKALFPKLWHIAVHFVIRCLSGKIGGTDAISKDLLSLLWALYYGRDIDIGTILWNDFRSFINPERNDVPHARYWSLCLDQIYKERKVKISEKVGLFVAQTLGKFRLNAKAPKEVRMLPRRLIDLISPRTNNVEIYLRFASCLLSPIDVEFAIPASTTEGAAADDDVPADTTEGVADTGETAATPPAPTPARTPTPTKPRSVPAVQPTAEGAALIEPTGDLEPRKKRKAVSFTSPISSKKPRSSTRSLRDVDDTAEVISVEPLSQLHEIPIQRDYEDTPAVSVKPLIMTAAEVQRIDALGVTDFALLPNKTKTAYLNWKNSEPTPGPSSEEVREKAQAELAALDPEALLKALQDRAVGAVPSAAEKISKTFAAEESQRQKALRKASFRRTSRAEKKREQAEREEREREEEKAKRAADAEAEAKQKAEAEAQQEKGAETEGKAETEHSQDSNSIQEVSGHFSTDDSIDQPPQSPSHSPIQILKHLSLKRKVKPSAEPIAEHSSAPKVSEKEKEKAEKKKKKKKSSRVNKAEFQALATKVDKLFELVEKRLPDPAAATTTADPVTRNEFDGLQQIVLNMPIIQANQVMEHARVRTVVGQYVQEAILDLDQKRNDDYDYFLQKVDSMIEVVKSLDTSINEAVIKVGKEHGEDITAKNLQIAQLRNQNYVFVAVIQKLIRNAADLFDIPERKIDTIAVALERLVKMVLDDKSLDQLSGQMQRNSIAILEAVNDLKLAVTSARGGDKEEGKGDEEETASADNEKSFEKRKNNILSRIEAAVKPRPTASEAIHTPKVQPAIQTAEGTAEGTPPIKIAEPAPAAPAPTSKGKGIADDLNEPSLIAAAENQRKEEERLAATQKQIEADKIFAAQLQERERQLQIQQSLLQQTPQEPPPVIETSVFQPLRLMTPADIVPRISYAAPATNDFNWDYPTSPNLKFIPMYDPLTERDDNLRYRKEIKRVTEYIQAWSKPTEEVWSCSPIKHLSGYKIRKYQKSRHFELNIERYDGTKVTISQADFPQMNPADLLNLANRMEQRIDKNADVKHYVIALRSYLSGLVFDFGCIDAELQKQFQDAPPLTEPNLSADDIPEEYFGTIVEPFRGVVYNDEQEDLRLVFRFHEKHLFSSSFLHTIINMIDQDDCDAETKKSMTEELRWYIACRRFWVRVLKFLEMYVEKPI